MSWVDLAALSIMLWRVISGCLGGLRTTGFSLAAQLFSLLAAASLNSSLTVFANKEWQAETVLARYLARLPGEAIGVFSPAPDPYGLLWEMRRSLAPRLALPVTAQNDPASLIAGLLVWTMSQAALFLLGLGVAAVIQKNMACRQNGPAGPERRKVAAFMVSVCFGLLSAVLFCVMLYALCFLPWAGFLWQDLQASYLLGFSRAIVSRAIW